MAGALPCSQGMHVHDRALDLVRRALGSAWDVRLVPDGAELLPAAPATGRVVALWGSDPERLVTALSRAEERLVPYGGCPLFTLASTDPRSPAARAALAGLAPLGAAPLSPEAADALVGGAAQARAAGASAEATAAGNATQPAGLGARHALVDELARRLGPDWRVTADASCGATVAPADEHAKGHWWVLPCDAASPAGAREVRSIMEACVAPFRLLGRAPRWSVITWVSRTSARSLALLSALELEPPSAELSARVHPFGADDPPWVRQGE